MSPAKQSKDLCKLRSRAFLLLKFENKTTQNKIKTAILTDKQYIIIRSVFSLLKGLYTAPVVISLCLLPKHQDYKYVPQHQANY